jgi:hypothetical protein
VATGQKIFQNMLVALPVGVDDVGALSFSFSASDCSHGFAIRRTNECVVAEFMQTTFIPKDAQRMRCVKQ